MFIGVVLNPQARKNRRAKYDRAARLRSMLGPYGAVAQTERIEDIAPALRELLPRATHLVSDGGDGALHHLIHGVRQQVPEPERWPAFVPTNGGTIDFVARKAGVRGRSETILARLVCAAAQGAPPDELDLDSLRIVGEHRGSDAPFDRIGFALAAGGVGQRFFDKYYALPDPDVLGVAWVIGRTVADFLLQHAPSDGIRALDQGFASHLFAPTRATVAVDGHTLPHREHGAIHAGAFDVNLGGLVRVFPLARAPGELHFQAGVIGGGHIIANLPNLFLGRAVRAPRLVDRVGERMVIEAEPSETLAPIIDGERFQGLRRLEVSRGPSIRVCTPRC